MRRFYAAGGLTKEWYVALNLSLDAGDPAIAQTESPDRQRVGGSCPCDVAPFRRPSPRHFASKATSIGRQSARPHNLLPDDGRWKKLQQPDFDVIDRGRPKQRTNGLCFARDGGLLSYGNDQVDSFRRAASYVDRILRGEKHGDLPPRSSQP